MTIKEIDEKILELKAERRKLEENKVKKFLESAKSNVGRCFKVNNMFVKVLDIPEVERGLNGAYYCNEHQYPAIWIDDSEDVPFYIDTLFSAAWGVGNDSANKYEEISKEEFNAEFDRRIDEFVKMIKEK